MWEKGNTGRSAWGVAMIIGDWGDELYLGFYHVKVPYAHALKRKRVYWVRAKQVSLPEMIKLWGKDYADNGQEIPNTDRVLLYCMDL